MVLRRAQRGPNAGNYFYGCSRYPRCNGTRPAEGNVSTRDNNSSFQQVQSVSFSPEELLELLSAGFDINQIFKTGDKSILIMNDDVENEKLTYSHPLYARSVNPNFLTRFFETVAVPYSMLNNFNDLIENDIDFKFYSQWRLDYPNYEGNRQSEYNVNLNNIISVAFKILTRGKITIPSPKVDKLLSQYFSNFPESTIDSHFRDFTTGKYRKEHWFDSQEEAYFFYEFLPKLFDEDIYHWVLPQVEINSLLSGDKFNSIQGRVDFLLNFPKSIKYIIEIDGAQHEGRQASDVERDRLLERSGYKVIRLKVNNLQLSSLQDSLKEPIGKYKEYISTLRSIDNFKKLYFYKIIHQIQLSVLTALEHRLLSIQRLDNWIINSDLHKLEFVGNQETENFILELALKDLVEFLEQLFYLYRINVKEFKDYQDNNHLHLSFTEDFRTDVPTVLISNIYFSKVIPNLSVPSVPIKLSNIEEKNIRYFLQYIFRKETFWEGQFETISRVLEGKDTIVLLPTGAGKSIAFQLAGFLLPGRTLVIDPIIALMDDQIDNLRKQGIDRNIAISSQIRTPEERKQIIRSFAQGEFIFTYVTPERFQTEEFRDVVRELIVHTPISFIAIDEAHCVSEWGHDFRTSYLNIGRVTREICKQEHFIPPLVALTGTASRSVLKDIQRELQITEFDAVITPKSFDRIELNYEIVHCRSNEKLPTLMNLLNHQLSTKLNISQNELFKTRENDTCCGLIFCPHVNGEFGVMHVTEKIKQQLNLTIDFYSGSDRRDSQNDDWANRKKITAMKFKNNKIPLMVCTKAFGMGIDKPNIRYTIHYGIPGSIEAFYQEAGRAGRNKEKAICVLLVSIDNTVRANKLLNPQTQVEEVNREIKEKVTWDNSDDVTRMLYFQSVSFPGVENEIKNVKEIIGQLKDVKTAAKKCFLIDREKRQSVEKGLHRLVLLGVVSDYTINYSNNEFTVTLSGASKEKIIDSFAIYVQGYSIDRSKIERQNAEKFIELDYYQFLEKMIQLLIRFIYDVIEKGRRRALYEMVQAVSKERSSQTDFREKILRYLNTTEFSDDLEEVISKENAGISRIKEIYYKITSTNDAAELRGQVSRYLESYPDQPSLLFLRSIAEIRTNNPNDEVIFVNFIAAIDASLNKYRIASTELYGMLGWLLNELVDSKYFEPLFIESIKMIDTHEYNRVLISEVKSDLCYIPVWKLLESLTEKVVKIIK